MALTKAYDAVTYIQALIIFQLKHPVKEIVEKISLNKLIIGRIKKRTKEQGYTPEMNPTIIIAYVEDTPQSGRPKKVMAEVEEKIIEAILKNLTIYQLFI